MVQHCSLDDCDVYFGGLVHNVNVKTLHNLMDMVLSVWWVV